MLPSFSWLATTSTEATDDNEGCENHQLMNNNDNSVDSFEEEVDEAKVGVESTLFVEENVGERTIEPFDDARFRPFKPTVAVVFGKVKLHNVLAYKK